MTAPSQEEIEELDVNWYGLGEISDNLENLIKTVMKLVENQNILAARLDKLEASLSLGRDPALFDYVETIRERVDNIEYDILKIEQEARDEKEQLDKINDGQWKVITEDNITLEDLRDAVHSHFEYHRKKKQKAINKKRSQIQDSSEA